MRQLFVISGAGLSAESGLSTFRDSNGLWERHDIGRICHMATWKANRSEVFRFYAQRRRDVAAAAPNAAHLAVAGWQARWGADNVHLLTQNVDDLLERAGATRVVHLHGDLESLLCTACGTRWAVSLEEYQEHTRCPKCKSLRGVKPGVVFFGERADQYRVLARMHKSIRADDVLIVIGTSFEVIPVCNIVPARKVGHPLTWQLNLKPEEASAFGKVVAEPATVGCELVEYQLSCAMDG